MQRLFQPANVQRLPAKLLDQFWRNIDPFDPSGQFCDKGPAYRTVIFVGTETLPASSLAPIE